MGIVFCLTLIKDHQYAYVLAATNVDTAQLELNHKRQQSEEFRSESALFAYLLGQALCASDTNSDVPYSFLGATEGITC